MNDDDDSHQSELERNFFDYLGNKRERDFEDNFEEESNEVKKMYEIPILPKINARIYLKANVCEPIYRKKIRTVRIFVPHERIYNHYSINNSLENSINLFSYLTNRLEDFNNFQDEEMLLTFLYDYNESPNDYEPVKDLSNRIWEYRKNKRYSNRINIFDSSYFTNCNYFNSIIFNSNSRENAFIICDIKTYNFLINEYFELKDIIFKSDENLHKTIKYCIDFDE